LLIADQGYGDVIQFSRYIPWAAQRCSSMAIACSSELHSAIAQLHPSAKIFDNWNDKPEFAAWLPLSGLPRLAGTRLDTIPAPVPYLKADPDRHGGHIRRASGGCHGQAGLDHAALRARLALAAPAQRQPLVPDRPPVSPIGQS
jgi:hypothetical protein